MQELLGLLQYGFVTRALIAGVLTAGLFALLGNFVILRKMSFFGEGIAHASLAGVAIGLLFNGEPLVTGVLYAVLFALLVYVLEKHTNLAPDSLIGVLFTSSLALGLLLMNLKPGYQPDLISFLFGNILTITNVDLILTVIVSVIASIFIISQYKKYILFALSPEFAYLAKIKRELYHILLYVILAVAVVLGIKLLGIVLVSAMLIIPASTAKIAAWSSRSLLALGIVFSEVSLLFGIFSSLLLNIPTSSAIVLSQAGLFLLVFFATVMTARMRAK